LEATNPQYQVDVKEGTSAPLLHHVDFTNDDMLTGKPDFQRPKTFHDQYIEQKAEEISQVFCIHFAILCFHLVRVS